MHKDKANDESIEKVKPIEGELILELNERLTL